jgi:hypothetical protein
MFYFKVLVADINIGYEEIVNTQVRNSSFLQVLLMLVAVLLWSLNFIFCVYLCRFLLSMVRL